MVFVTFSGCLRSEGQVIHSGAKAQRVAAFVEETGR